jgi:hypothetical protein
MPEACEICLDGHPDRSVIFESPLVEDPVRIEICEACELAFTQLIVDRYHEACDRMNREVAFAKRVFGIETSVEDGELVSTEEGPGGPTPGPSTSDA